MGFSCAFIAPRNGEPAPYTAKPKALERSETLACPKPRFLIHEPRKQLAGTAVTSETGLPSSYRKISFNATESDGFRSARQGPRESYDKQICRYVAGNLQPYVDPW